MKSGEALHVNSEINPLVKVIVHSPDEGILRVSPKKSEELLFDDIVYLPVMQAEHQIFTKVLRALIGENQVYEIRQLLEEALSVNAVAKEVLIDGLMAYEELPSSFGVSLVNKPNSDLADTLITGYDTSEDRVLFDPIPNFLFTRDIAVTINDHILITKAAKQARTRENFLTRFIMYHHPLFLDVCKTNKLIDLNVLEQFPPSKKGEPVSMEGGDIMVLNKDYIIIGISERTNMHAFNTLKSYLFKHEIASNVVLFNIPSDRSFMHIDTIMTQIDEHRFVAYKPIVSEGFSSFVEVYRNSGEIQKYATMKKCLRKEISSEIEFTWVGNGITPAQEREQWTDGCNLLTIRPGVAITYDRNPVTGKVLSQVGYNTVTAREILDMSKNELNDLNKTIITIPSSELARARGGPHCMSCPIHRISSQA